MGNGNRTDSANRGTVLSQEFAAAEKAIVNEIESLPLDAPCYSSTQHTVCAVVHKYVRKLLAAAHANEKAPNPQTNAGADAVAARAVNYPGPDHHERNRPSSMGLPGDLFLNYLAVGVRVALVRVGIQRARFVEHGAGT